MKFSKCFLNLVLNRPPSRLRRRKREVASVGNTCMNYKIFHFLKLQLTELPEKIQVISLPYFYFPVQF